MNTVLITIVGPDGRADAAAPADAPIAELLPGLARLAGAGGAHDWEVALPGRPALSGDRTLGEQGVADGGVLQLRAAGASPEPLARAAARERAPLPIDGLSPVARTRAALPEWFSVAERLRRAARSRASWRATDYDDAVANLIGGPRVRGPIVIAVVSPGAGEGRTTVAAALALAFVRLRSDDRVATVGTGGPYLDADGYERVIADQASSADIVVVDCGPGFEDPAAQAALRVADQLVLVVAADDGAAGRVAAAGELLGDDGPPAVLAVNRVARRGRDGGGLERALPDARGLIALRDDPRQAGQIVAGGLPAAAWELPVRELAALLAADWPCLGLAA